MPVRKVNLVAVIGVRIFPVGVVYNDKIVDSKIYGKLDIAGVNVFIMLDIRFIYIYNNYSYYKVYK